MPITTKRQSIINIVFLCVGCIIGWGAFVLPQDLFLSKVGMLNAIIGLGIGALLMRVIAYNYSFLIIKLGSGGEFIFALRILGKKHGFICGWFLSLAYLCIIPLNATALSLLIDSLNIGFLHLCQIYSIANTPVYLGDVILSLVSICFIAFANFKGISVALQLQRILVVVLIVGVFVFCVMMSFESELWNNLLSHLHTKPLAIESIVIVIAISPWLYLGFDCAVQVLADIAYNQKKFELLTYISIWIGCCIYCATICIVAFGIPADKISLYPFAIGVSIEQNFGVLGSIVLALGIFGAIMSGINGFFIATSKSIATMAYHKILPQCFVRQNSNNSHYNAIIFIAIISCIMPFFGRKSLLYVVDMSAIGIVIAFLYVGIVSLIVKKHYFHRISLMSVACILLSIAFIALLFVPFSPSVLRFPSLIALLVWCIIGIGFYTIMQINSPTKNQ